VSGLRPDLILELIVDETAPDDVEVAQRVVAALDRVGLAVRYQALPAREFVRRLKVGDCDLYVDQLVPPATDRLGEYVAAFAAGGDRWPVRRLEDPAFTPAMARAAFAERLPVIPLFHGAVRAHHKRLLRGLAVDALGRLELADAFFLPRVPDESFP
jgi:hypothetical protein